MSDVSASLVEQYVDCKSKVNISGEETRVELMGKVLEMDEEISALLSELRMKDAELKSLRSKMKEDKDDNQRKEKNLTLELDMLTKKNSAMSDLYEMVADHAEAVEEELERRRSMIFDEDSAPAAPPGQTQ